MNHSSPFLASIGFALLVASIALQTGTVGASEFTTNPAAAAVAAQPLPLDFDLEQALQMPPGPDQTKAAIAAAKAWAERDAKGYLTWALAAPLPLFGVVQQSASACGKCPEVKAAADWLVQQDAPKLTMILHGVMLGWAHEDMAAAEAWCTQLHTTTDHRYVSIFTVADALCRKDPPAAVAWTATWTALEDRQAALDGTVTIWIRGGFAVMTTWLKQLNPADMKWAALVAARNWRAKAKQPDISLAAWLDQLPLSAADKGEIQKGPYPDSYSISKYMPAPKPGKP